MSGADTLKAIEVMNPKRRDMARLEDDAEQRIAAALDKWRRDLTRGMTADNAPFIVSRLQQRDVYQPFYDAIIAVLRDLALAGAGFGREQIEQAIYGTRKGLFDVVWDLVNAAAEAWARQFGGQLIRGITETTRQRVAATVADWTTNDEGIYALTQRLAEPNGPFGQSRARTIAVTETTRAYAEGNRAAWRESNVVTRRRWNTNVDEAVCPICGPLHNVVVGLDESYPGGLDGPPAHPNCRCWVTPVVPGAEERETGLGQFGLGRPVTVVNPPTPAIPKMSIEEQTRLVDAWFARDDFMDVYGGSRKPTREAVLKAKMGIVDNLTAAANVDYSDANSFVRSWAITSNDHAYSSMDIQRAASKHFGVELSDWQKTRLAETVAKRTENISLLSQGEVPAISPRFLAIGEDPSIPGRVLNSSTHASLEDITSTLVRETYDATQSALADLKAQGVERVTLYRGVAAPDLKINTLQQFDSNVLESWSIDRQTAEKFAHARGGGKILKIDAPLEQIYSTARTGPGCLDEFEFILIKNSDDVFLVEAP